MSQFSIKLKAEDLKKATCVVVTVNLKKSSVDTEGIFVGYRSVVDRDMDLVGVNDKYIWLYKNACVHMFSILHYDIKTVEIELADPKVSRTLSFKADDTKEQNEARSLLEVVIAGLKEANKVQYNGLVKIDSLTMPDKYKDMMKEAENKTTSTSSTQTGTANYQTGHKPYNNIHNRTSTWQRKEVSTDNMKRTTRYDVTAAMEVLNVKFREIKDGTYVPPRLARIPADKMEENGGDDDNSATAAANGYTDPYGNHEYGWC